MKFLLAVDRFSQGSGGATRSAQELARAILERGHQVVAVEQSHRIEVRSWRGMELVQTKLNGPLLPSDGTLRTLLLNPRWRTRLAVVIDQTQPDLVVTSGMLAPGAIAAARDAGLPSVYFFRGYAPLCPTQFQDRDPLRDCEGPSCRGCLSSAKWLKSPLIHRVLRLYRREIPRADLVVANSHYVAKLLTHFWELEPEVLLPPLGMEPAEEPANDPEGGLLFVKPQRIKGAGRILELARAMPDRPFVVAGELKPSTRATLGSLPNIQLLGWRDDMQTVLRQTRLVLGPSRWPEPFGRIFAEAASQGVPTVASRVGGLSEAAGEEAILLEPEAGIEEWRQAIHSLDDPDRYDRQRRLALEHARKLATASNMNPILDRLEALAGRTPARSHRAPAPSVGRKVIHVIGALPLGGAEQSLFHLVTGLQGPEFDPLVVCLREEGELAEEFRRAGVPVQLIKVPSRYSPRGIRKLVTLFRREGAVYVHTHMRRANTTGRIAAWLAGVPIILAHERNLPHHKRTRHVIVDRILSRISTRILGVSPQVVEANRRRSGIPPHRFTVITNGVDPTEFQPGEQEPARARLGIDPDSFVLGFAGRLHGNKRLHVLIEATARAAAKIPELQLLLIGQGRQQTELEELARRFDSSRRVLFLGQRRDMPEIYPALDVLCLVSMIEGCSRALLEGMACGLPSIATPVGFAEELLGRDEAGLLVPVDQVEPVVEAILRLHADPELRRRMGQEARRRSLEHDLANHQETIRILYRRLWLEHRLGTL